jgi:hypothetical protein
MLRLTFHTKSNPASADAVELSDLEVAGGALSNSVEQRLIATYSDGSWRYRERSYSILAVTGGGRLLLCITRGPTVVSDPIDHFYLIGATLSANGVAIAKYIEQQNMWRAMLRPMCWRTMRIVNAANVSALVDESQLVPLNPWEPDASQGGLPDYLLEGRTEAPVSIQNVGRRQRH